MLLTCCAQYFSKFEIFWQCPQDRKCKFSIQSQRKLVPKNVQTTVQLCLFHMLARLCLKSFYLGFRGTWTEKSSCISYVSKRQRKQIKLPVCIGSWGKQGIQEKNIYFCFIDYARTFDCVDHNKLWKILKGMGVLDHLTCLPRNLYVGQESTVITGHGTMDWFKIGEAVCKGYISSSCLFYFYV